MMQRNDWLRNQARHLMFLWNMFRAKRKVKNVEKSNCGWRYCLLLFIQILLTVVFLNEFLWSKF